MSLGGGSESCNHNSLFVMSMAVYTLQNVCVIWFKVLSFSVLFKFENYDHAAWILIIK
jgi:hypothetical protein